MILYVCNTGRFLKKQKCQNCQIWIEIQPNNGLWSGASNYWGGFNFGLDYEITNRIITNINFSRMFTNRPFLNKLAERNPYYTDLATEISFGMTYKF